MCGIIGYVGGREAKPLLLSGLRRLEYRGYDSAGIALREDGRPRLRPRGRQPPESDRRDRAERLRRAPRPRSHALGDARRRHRVQNAHPLIGCDASKLAIVLNGIVENYRELREQLLAEGHTFTSETDAEVVVHMLEQRVRRRSRRRRSSACTRCSRGTSRSSRSTTTNPDLLVGVRHQTPLVVGLGDGENFLASNVAAFLSETRRAVFPDDGEVVEITPAGARFFKDGVEVEHPAVEELDWDDEAGREGRLRDLHAEGDLRAARGGARDDRRPRPRPPARCSRRSASTELEVRNLRRIVIVAAGTSYHAGVVGRYIIEEWARVPVEPDIASEWIYRNPVLSKDTLVIGISQSGESRDTVNADEARARARRAHARDHEHDGHADHARGRRDAVHALRHRDRRRRVEDVHGAGRAAQPARAAARRDPADAAAGGDRVHPRPACTSCPTRSRSSSTATTRSTRSRSASTTSRSSSTSAATSACPSRSRAR